MRVAGGRPSTANAQALDTLVAAIEEAGEVPGERVVVSLDVAASEFGSNGRYRLALEDRTVDTDALVEMLAGWIERYPIASIEDPLAEDDAEGMRRFTGEFGERVQIIGDDLLVTECGPRGRGRERPAPATGCSSRSTRPGTVSESIAAFRAARRAGFATVVSARSGETEDVSICHIAVGLGAGQLKVGSFARSERMAKWNECLRIGEHPGIGGFAGGRPLAGNMVGAEAGRHAGLIGNGLPGPYWRTGGRNGTMKSDIHESPRNPVAPPGGPVAGGWMGSACRGPLRSGAARGFGVWRVRTCRDGKQGNNHERI